MGSGEYRLRAAIVRAAADMGEAIADAIISASGRSGGDRGPVATGEETRAVRRELRAKLRNKP